MNQALREMKSPFGTLYLSATANGLRYLYLNRPPSRETPLLPGKDGERQLEILAQAVAELEEYFAGRRKAFDVPVDLEGTAFQKRVWEQLKRIPYGQTCSYRELAKKVNNDKAVRAVGSANGKNPVSIIVPCHRVIAADGKLGGYSGGLANKEKLLALEGVNI